MRLYLVQHGEATAREEDPARPLSERGRDDARRVARAARAAGVTVATLIHSGRLRARQTAEILAELLPVRDPPAEHTDLGPNDDPAAIAQVLADMAAPVMIVGHLPHLSRLASLLVTGSADLEVVSFRNAGIVALEGPGVSEFALVWILTPELVPGPGP